MGWFKPSQQSGGQWRHRHKIAYYLAIGLTGGFDIAFAALVAWDHFSLPAYVWVTCVTISILEASTIALSALLIKLHVGRRRHADMGDALLPLWCGSLTINIAYLYGSYGEILDNEIYWRCTAALGVLSQVAGIVLVAMSYLYHVVSLRNGRNSAPTDEEAAPPGPDDSASQSSGGSSGSEKSSGSLIRIDRLYSNKQTEEIELHKSSVQILPWITAVLMVLLAVSSFWGWGASKDHLPSYLQGPALIGGSCCCVAGISCVVAFFFITKGENHWTKDKHANLKPQDRRTHTHPMENWPHTLVFGTTMAAILTEGAYLYMLACILISKESVDQCLRFSTSIPKCEGKGLPWVGMISLLLCVAVACGLWFEMAMQSSIARFNKFRGPLRNSANANGSYGGSYNGSSGNNDGWNGGNGGSNGSYGAWNSGRDDDAAMLNGDYDDDDWNNKRSGNSRSQSSYGW